MATTRVRMVCFDIGGVLVKHFRTWPEACAGLGVEYRAGIDDPGLLALRRAAGKQYALGRIDEEEFYRELVRGVAGLYTPEEVRHVHTHWITSEYDGIGEVMDRLVGLGRARTAVLSNTNATHWRRLAGGDGARADFPTPGKVQRLFASHLMGLAKPDPMIYEAFEREAGVAPGEILFFDDLPENIEAAAGRGWNASRVDHTGDTATQVRAVLEQHGLI
ncbi:MAG: HAD-IA family hydrolase [Phycisphaerales bacterium]|nr:HAD-IA family hydrolase [Phycisphaerales bacterium]